MRIPKELEQVAFKASNGELSWKRIHIPMVVEFLVNQHFAILGGELWWVPPGASHWTGLIPQKTGPDGVYTWETERHNAEDWLDFINRCAQDTIEAIYKWPEENELREDIASQILYNLTWISESEYNNQ